MKKNHVISLFVLFTYLFLYLGVLSSSVLAEPIKTLSYDKIYIFGDSMTDNGNFPEIFNYKSTSVPPLYNLFVPISNPVNSNLYGTKLENLSYPTAEFLSAATSEQSTIDSQLRKYKSINWVDYLIFNSLKNKQLIPWIKVRNKSYSGSINYAWAGALSIDGYADQNYNFMDNISFNELYNLQQKYRTTGGDLNKVAIPGLIKQVGIHAADLAADKINLNNSAHIIYIGGNDISRALRKDVIHLRFKKSVLNAANNVKIAVDRLIKLGAKHIYVVKYFDISNLPSVRKQNIFIRWLVIKLAKYGVKTFNDNLTQTFKNYPQVTVIETTVDELAKSKEYSNSVKYAKECVLEQKGYLPNAIVSCAYRNGMESYFGWNDSHLTTRIHQQMAIDIANQMQLH